MSFLEPMFLVALAGAALPLLVHLINRRKAVRVDFPALAFLLQSNRREARGIKVRQWALMALRMLVIAALAMALAKPFMLSSEGISASDRLPTATVFVVDTSYSMAQGDWWADARRELNSRVGQLRTWDEVALVTTAPGAPRPVSRLTGAHRELRDAVDKLQPTSHRTHLVDALYAASEILDPSALPNRRIIVISDLAEGGFSTALAPSAPLDYPVEFVEVRDPEKTPDNFSIEAVTYEQEGSSREPMWRIDVSVRNRASKDASVELRLDIDGETKAGGLLEVAAGKSAKHSFRHRLDGTGVHHGLVRLIDADGLPADDARHFPIQLRATIRTLLVNGEPSAIAFHDEMFFLERALNPRADTNSNIVPELTTREGLEKTDLAGYDVVVMSNVAKITPATATKLEQFVEGGGGLLLTMGDQVDVTAYNQTLGNLLPKPLRSLKQLALRDDPDAPIKITHFGPPRRQHPVFRVFQLPGGSALQQVSVFSYMLLEPSPPEQSQLVLSFEDNAPALLEREVGRGRVLLLTTSIDDEWTDFPFQPAFLPLSRRAVQYLARRGGSSDAAQVLIGDTIQLEVQGLIQERAIVLGPGDTRLVVEPRDGVVSVTPTEPGVYTVWADDTDDETQRLDALAFAANVDTGESALDALPLESLAPWIGQANADAKMVAATREAEKRVNLWPMFLFGVTLFLLFETILGTRRSVLARMARFVLRRPDPAIPEA